MTTTVFQCQIFFYTVLLSLSMRGARWLSGRASDSGARGQGFETYLRRVVSLNKTLYSQKVLVIPRKLWLHPDMTKKMLTGMLSLNIKISEHGFSSRIKSRIL